MAPGMSGTSPYGPTISDEVEGVEEVHWAIATRDETTTTTTGEARTEPTNKATTTPEGSEVVNEASVEGVEVTSEATSAATPWHP